MNDRVDRARPRRRANAREVATEVVYRVVTDGAWATPTLDAALARADLDTRDAALATSLTYGTLRVLPSLDAALDAHLDRPAKLDAWARAAMRVAAFQIRHQPRIPVSAAVNEAVALVRAERGHLASLANAVLRKLVRPDDAEPPTALEVPRWIEAALVRALGEPRARSFLEARSMPPPLDLRVRGDREALARTLRLVRPEGEIELGLAEHVLHARRVGDPRELPGYADGRFVVQEQGAQLLGTIVGAMPGEHVLDACAGHGGKTLQLVEAVGPTGRVVANDIHEAKLDRGTEERARLGLADAPVESIAIDWTVGDGGFGEDPKVATRGGFDRVLVDAPCTGLGTIHRRPELTLRASWDDVVALAKTQRAILERVAPLVRPGGVLFYAVCSPLAEEGPVVARALSYAHPELVPMPLRIADASSDEDGVLRLGPWLDGCDAYQVAAWRRLGWSASPTSGE